MEVPDLPGVYPLEQLGTIPTPVRDIEFILQPKWKIASDQPGSGNTKNIGSVKELAALREGRGPFALLGEEGRALFDQYWQEYLTPDMARKVDLPRPLFRNLREYLERINRPDLVKRLDESRPIS